MFGALVRDVQALIPAVAIGSQGETLTPGMVEGHIDRFDGEVALALGSLTGLTSDQHTQVVAAGRRLVADAAASISIAAYYMLSDQPHAENGYGSLLWKRYESGLKTLTAMIQGLRETDGIDDDGLPGRRAVALDLRPPFYLDQQY